MSISILEALPGKLDIKRHLPSRLYVTCSVGHCLSFLSTMSSLNSFKEKFVICIPASIQSRPLSASQLNTFQMAFNLAVRCWQFVYAYWDPTHTFRNLMKYLFVPKVYHFKKISVENKP